MINTVHLNPNSFENVLNESPKTMWFVGLDIDKKKGLNIDLTNDINNFIFSGEFRPISAACSVRFRSANRVSYYLTTFQLKGQPRLRTTAK